MCMHHPLAQLKLRSAPADSTDAESGVQLVAQTIPIASLWCIPDGFLGTIQGVLRQA